MNSPGWWSNLHPGSLAAFVLAAMVVVIIGVLTLQHDTVPGTLDNVLYILLGTGGSIAIANTSPVVTKTVDVPAVPTPVAQPVTPTVPNIN
jgi:hypothetical protein